MNKLKMILFSVFSTFLTGCWFPSLTNAKREKFKTKCKSQIYFDTGSICFAGFPFEQIDTIRVVEKDGITPINTLYIYPRQERHNHNTELQEFWGIPEVQFNVNHSYEFYLDSDKPYILDNMEMIIWAQYSMVSKGWGCKMGNFTIDNEKFERQGRIYFKKRGFKYDWE